MLWITLVWSEKEENQYHLQIVKLWNAYNKFLRLSYKNMGNQHLTLKIRILDFKVCNFNSKRQEFMHAKYGPHYTSKVRMRQS